MPPLWSDARDSVADFEEFDLLYPLLTMDRFGTERRFQIGQLFSFAAGKNQKEDAQHRFTLFPFYFQQRSTDTNLNYTALFPVYGHLKDRLFKDDIQFTMFPLYSKTRKRDVETKNYIFPFFHLRHGDGLRGWQLWPLVGHEQKIPTECKKLFDTVEAIPGHDKWFAAWPFYFNIRTDIGSTNEGHELTSIPFYSEFRSPQRDSTTVLWPFFNVIDDRVKKYHERQMPWPFIIFARGEGKTTSRVWPFYSQSHDATQESDFYMWPIYKYNRLHADPLDRERTRIFFFLYSDIIQRNTETGKFLRRSDFFPFYTYHRDYNGDERLQVLAPVEPFLPNNKSIERNYSPLWSFWRAERNGTTGAHGESLFWNLYRHEEKSDAEKYSLLFGFLRYQSGVDGDRWRLFYIPFGKAEPPAPPPHFEPLTEMPATNAVPRIEHPHYDEATRIK